MKKINIMFLVTSFSIGGAENIIYRLSKYMDKDKYKITVSALYTDDGLLIDKLKSISDVQYFSLNMKSKLDFFVIWRLYNELKKRKIDVLYTFLFHPNILGRIVGKLAKVNINISSERSVMDKDKKLRVLLNRLTYKFNDKITCVSNAVKKYLIEYVKVPENKLEVIYNAVEINELKPKMVEQNKKIIIGFTGRLHSVNGHIYLLEAIKILKSKSIENIELHLYGKGDLKNFIVNKCKELGIENDVKLFGYTDDIHKALKTFDIYVQPAIYAGMPNTVIEAMAAGVPIVATDVGGTNEVVVDKKTGFLVKAKNAKQLSEKIKILYNSIELRKKFGLSGYNRVKELFSIEIMAKKTGTLLDKLTKK